MIKIVNGLNKFKSLRFGSCFETQWKAAAGNQNQLPNFLSINKSKAELKLLGNQIGLLGYTELIGLMGQIKVVPFFRFTFKSKFPNKIAELDNLLALIRTKYYINITIFCFPN